MAGGGGRALTQSGVESLLCGAFCERFHSATRTILPVAMMPRDETPFEFRRLAGSQHPLAGVTKPHRFLHFRQTSPSARAERRARTGGE